MPSPLFEWDFGFAPEGERESNSLSQMLAPSVADFGTPDLYQEQYGFQDMAPPPSIPEPPQEQLTYLYDVPGVGGVYQSSNGGYYVGDTYYAVLPEFAKQPEPPKVNMADSLPPNSFDETTQEQPLTSDGAQLFNFFRQQQESQDTGQPGYAEQYGFQDPNRPFSGIVAPDTLPGMGEAYDFQMPGDNYAALPPMERQRPDTVPGYEEEYGYRGWGNSAALPENSFTTPQYEAWQFQPHEPWRPADVQRFVDMLDEDPSNAEQVGVPANYHMLDYLTLRDYMAGKGPEQQVNSSLLSLPLEMANVPYEFGGKQIAGVLTGAAGMDRVPIYDAQGNIVGYERRGGQGLSDWLRGVGESVRNPIEAGEAYDEYSASLPWYGQVAARTVADPTSYIGAAGLRNLGIEGGLAFNLLDQGGGAAVLGGTLAAGAANEVLPEDMPFRTPAVLGAGLVGGVGGALGASNIRTIADAAGELSGVSPMLREGAIPGGGVMMRKGLPSDFPADTAYTPRPIIPESGQRVQVPDPVLKYADPRDPTDFRVETKDGMELGLVRLDGEGSWLAIKGDGSSLAKRFPSKEEAINFVNDVVEPTTVQPLANERLWVSSTNKFDFDSLDPEAGYGTSTAITQGPGIYLASNPQRSAPYGQRSFFVEFDGRALNLLDQFTPNSQIFDGGPTWIDVQRSLEQRIGEPLGDVFSDGARQKVLARANDDELLSPNNGYAYRDALVHALSQKLMSMPPEVRKEIWPNLSKRFSRATNSNNWRSISLAAIYDAMADFGVDAIFHYSPFADGEVLIVLNGEAARIIGESKFAGRALLQADSLRGVKDNMPSQLSISEGKTRWVLDPNGNPISMVSKTPDGNYSSVGRIFKTEDELFQFYSDRLKGKGRFPSFEDYTGSVDPVSQQPVEVLEDIKRYALEQGDETTAAQLDEAIARASAEKPSYQDIILSSNMSEEQKADSISLASEKPDRQTDVLLLSLSPEMRDRVLASFPSNDRTAFVNGTLTDESGNKVNAVLLLGDRSRNIKGGVFKTPDGEDVSVIRFFDTREDVLPIKQVDEAIGRAVDGGSPPPPSKPTQGSLFDGGGSEPPKPPAGFDEAGRPVFGQGLRDYDFITAPSPDKLPKWAMVHPDRLGNMTESQRTAIKDLQTAVLDVNRQLRESGVTPQEIRFGRSALASKMQNALDEARASGISGTELDDYVMASLPAGIMRQTLTDVPRSVQDELDYFFDVIYRTYPKDKFTTLSAAEAMRSVLDGNLQPHEEQILRAIFGDDLSEVFRFGNKMNAIREAKNQATTMPMDLGDAALSPVRATGVDPDAVGPYTGRNIGTPPLIGENGVNLPEAVPAEVAARNAEEQASRMALPVNRREQVEQAYQEAVDAELLASRLREAARQQPNNAALQVEARTAADSANAKLTAYQELKRNVIEREPGSGVETLTPGMAEKERAVQPSLLGDEGTGGLPLEGPRLPEDVPASAVERALADQTSAPTSLLNDVRNAREDWISAELEAANLRAEASRLKTSEAELAASDATTRAAQAKSRYQTLASGGKVADEFYGLPGAPGTRGPEMNAPVSVGDTGDLALRPQTRADVELGVTPRAGKPTPSVPTEHSKWKEHVQEVWREILGFPKAAKASADLSATLRQAAPLGFSHPAQYASAFKAQLKAVKSQEYFDELMREIRQAPYAEVRRKAGLFLADAKNDALLNAREEAFMSKAFSKIPLIKGTERGYIAMLDKLRADVFDDIWDRWVRTGVDPSAEDARQLADFINHATGRGTGKFLDAAGQHASAVFFSPRYMASKPQMFADLLMKSGPTRNEVARTLAAWSAGVATLTGLAVAGGAQLGYNPFDSKFGRVVSGRETFDFTGGVGGDIRTLSQVMKGTYDVVRGEDVEETPLDTLGKYFRGKNAPAASILVDILRGRTYDDKKIDWTTLQKDESGWRMFTDAVTPLSMSAITDAFKAEFGDGQGITKGGAVRATAATLANIFGIGVNSNVSDYASMSTRMDLDFKKYQPSGYEKPKDYRDDPLYMKQWQESHPDAKPDPTTRLGKDIAHAQEKFQKDSGTNNRLAEGGTRTIAEWRDERKGIARVYRDDLEDAYKGVNEKKAEPGTPRAWVDSWFGLYDEATDKDTGELDPEKLGELQSRWMAENGQGAVKYIQDYGLVGKTGIDADYIRDMQKLTNDGYWDMPKYFAKISDKTDDEIDELRRYVADKSKHDDYSWAAGLDYDKRAKLILLDKGEDITTITDVINAGKDKYLDPDYRLYKAEHPELMLWFNPSVTYPTYLSLKPE